MAKPHKYAGAHVDVMTAVSADQVRRVAHQVIENIKEVTIESETPAGFTLNVRSWARVRQITFYLTINATESGAHARTEIDWYLTSQAKFLFIPIGPKEMVGYKAYRRFMQTFARAVQSVDPSARTSIVETTPTA